MDYRQLSGVAYNVHLYPPSGALPSYNGSKDRHILSLNFGVWPTRVDAAKLCVNQIFSRLHSVYWCYV